MKRKCFAIVIILLFVGTCTIPSIPSKQMHEKTIITVDDEPGDADFTSIKEALNASSPGDTIEVYSGTYYEQGIRIVKDNITLLGVSHELGDGDDSGQPFVRGDGSALVIHVEESHVAVSNLFIENQRTGESSSHSCMSVGNTTIGIGEPERNNITIANCSISNGGMIIGDVGKNIMIIDNEIRDGGYGISTVTVTHKYWMTSTIRGNVITDCNNVGILFDRTGHNISGNTIKRCGRGIEIYPPGCRNTIYGNDIENCPIGVMITSEYGENTIIKNNFKNYSQLKSWFQRSVYLSFWGLIIYFSANNKDQWKDNYWDTWNGIGSKKILGTLTIQRYFYIFPIELTIPLIYRDNTPAQEPYDING